MAREMKDSGVQWVGTIPKSWKTIKFKYLHDGLNTGEAIDKNFWSAEENDRVFYTAGVFPIRTNYENFPAWKLTTENDLLLARNGTPYVYSPKAGACYTDHIIRAIMKKGINKRYVQYSLQQSIASVVIDTVSIATWSASLWNEQSIAWPSNNEQSSIVAYLDIKCAEIDTVLEKTRTSIEEYKKLKQAIITQAVTKGIRGDRPMKESGIEWIGEIPVDWETITLKKCVDILPGYAFSSQDFDAENGIPLLRGINVGLNEIRWEDVVYWNKPLNESLEAFRLEENDIVVGLDRPWIAGGTRVAYIQKCDLPCLLLQRVCRIRPIADIDRRLIGYWISSDMFKEALSNSTTGVSVPHISTKQIEQFVIAIPPNHEDRDICDYLDKQCEKIDVLMQKKERLFAELESYKKSLIYEYVTGKKEVL